MPLYVQVIPYWVAQYLGAFLSSAVVYGLYLSECNECCTAGAVSQIAYAGVQLLKAEKYV